VPASLPLSTLLSQVVVAQTIEVDNEFERRLLQSGEDARVTSLVMWSNFLRFVGDGISVGELPAAAGLPKARVLSNLGGMERWRYVYVAPARSKESPGARRDGYGSARGLHADWMVRPTPAGRFAQRTWPGLFGEVEQRWVQRFGGDAIRELRGSLEPIVGVLDVDLPRSLPIVASSDGLRARFEQRPRSQATASTALVTLLAQALLAYALDFERESDVSLTLAANVVRILERELPAREIPGASGISKEATSVALTALTKSGLATVDGRSAATTVVRLTAEGEEARRRVPAIHRDVRAAWTARFGERGTARLAAALETILAHPSLAEGLRPDPAGWRASSPYLARTEALLADPRATLPHHPFVLHRGGWPDGS